MLTIFGVWVWVWVWSASHLVCRKGLCAALLSVPASPSFRSVAVRSPVQRGFAKSPSLPSDARVGLRNEEAAAVDVTVH